MTEDNLPPVLEFVIEPEDRGCRLDVFLSTRCGYCSRNRIKKLIQDGFVLVNGSPVKAAYEVRLADRITARLEPARVEGALVPHPMPLDVLFEDEDILVLNKPPGVIVHPGAGHEDGTLVHGLLARCGNLASQGAPWRPGIVHRLDKNTSGALVVAKSDRAYLDLIRQFKEHSVVKEYAALVYGSLPRPSGDIRTMMGRHPVDRKKMAVLEKGGREAISSWNVETDWGEVSLLRVRIRTGRTHQIRVHLSYLLHPVVGDDVYGGGRRKAHSVKSIPLKTILLAVDRQMLHAAKLEFHHPVSRDLLSFCAPLPPDFADLIETLRTLMSSEPGPVSRG